MRERLPLRAIFHRERYHRYYPEEIQAHYRTKEVSGLARYLNNPELRQLADSTGAKNLAQVYTKVKYTRQSHLEYSATVLNYLSQQGFMEHPPSS